MDSAAPGQIELLREVLDLARSQREALSREDLDAFDAATSRREALLSATDTDAASDDDGALEALAEQILQLDRANEATLANLMVSIRDEMPALAKGAQANAAYRLSERPSTFINRVS
ncbi:MAG: hypothetical protein R3C39_06410 [Dehalococcoidia bacterium]